jgi:heterodisulfide reductase subunit C
MGLPASNFPALPAVSDPGLDENAKTLTPEKISQVINRVLDKETAARFRVYLNTCVHCGLCSDACHWFLSNDRDPRFSPVGKVKQTLWEMLRRKGKGRFPQECS